MVMSTELVLFATISAYWGQNSSSLVSNLARCIHTVYKSYLI